MSILSRGESHGLFGVKQYILHISVFNKKGYNSVSRKKSREKAIFKNPIHIRKEKQLRAATTIVQILFLFFKKEKINNS